MKWDLDFLGRTVVCGAGEKLFCTPFVGFACDRKSGQSNSANIKLSDLAHCYVHAASLSFRQLDRKVAKGS